MEITLMPFTQEMWSMYSGCEGEPKFTELTLPLNEKRLPCVVVVDDNGINLDYWEDDSVCHDFQFPMDNAGVARAEAVLRQFNLDNPRVTVAILQDLGFIYHCERMEK